MINVRKFKKLNEAMDATMGASNMVQGNGYGYVYRILPFNRSLEQKGTPQDDSSYIHVGREVKGKNMDSGKEFRGTLMRILKNHKGEIFSAWIMSDGKIHTNIDPASIKPINNSKNKSETQKNDVFIQKFTPSHNVQI